MITVRYHAVARELTGRSEERIELDLPGCALEALSASLGERHPGLRDHLSRMRFAINGDFATRDDSVRDGDEVDVLPPVAGGGPDAPRLVAIREQPLSVDECMTAVRHPGAGGIAVFTGVVRDHAEGRSVARLDYEAYGDLAIKEMIRIIEALEQEIPGVCIAVTHRVGTLRVGDVAVVVAASAPHRAEAFAACRAAIDRIKETVPIWKKEWDADGNAHWVGLC